MKGDSDHNLHEVKPQRFNETSVSMHRTNEDVHFAIMCDAKPFRGDTVEVVGVWTDGNGATQEVRVRATMLRRANVEEGGMHMHTGIMHASVAHAILRRQRLFFLSDPANVGGNVLNL